MAASRHHIGMVFGPIIVLLSMILACVTSSWAESPQKQIASEKATAVIHCSYAPVTFWDKNSDKPSGFAVDIINSAAGHAGLKINYICKPGWPEMITSVETGEADISVLLKSEERKKILLFSSPIDITYLSYFARSQSTIDPDTVPQGYTVGVITGSRSYEHLKNRQGVNLTVEGTYHEGIFSLLAGEIDLFAGEEALIHKQASEAGLDDRIKKIGNPFSEQERCLAVRKDNVQLLERLNNALQGFIGSPEYQRIYINWYGAPAQYWTTHKILLASGLFLFIAFCGMAYWRYKSIFRINRELVQTVDERIWTEESLRESEDKFRSIFERATDGIMIADAKTARQIEANKSMCIMLGYTRDEIVGLRIDDIHPKKELPAIRGLFEKQLNGEISLAPEVPMLRKDGSIFYADITAARVTLGGKECLAGIFRDITERKRADAALREREKQLAESQRIAHIGSWEHNPETGRVFWSDELFRLLGLDPRKDPADFNLFFEMIHPDDRPALKKAVEMTLQQHIPFNIEYRFILRDGTTRIIHAQAELIPDESGKLVVLSGTAQNITERKRAETALAVSEGRYRSLFEDSPISMWEEDFTELQEHLAALRSSGITDLGAHFTDHPDEVLKCVGLVRIVSVNRATLDMYEAPDQAALLQGLSRVFIAQSFESFRGILVALAEGARMYECETVNQTLTGRTINVLLRWSLLGGDRTDRSRALISIVDITASKKAGEKIRQSEEFIRSILDTVDEGFIVIDRDYRIMTANRAYCGQVDRPCDDVIGRHCFEISHKTNRPCYEEGEECAVHKVLETGNPHVVLHKHADHEGHVLYVETKGFPIKDAGGSVISVIETINNITEKHLLEEERLKTQKLESIGTLAGGIAHDFNNLLQGIFGYISMAKMTLDRKEKSLAMLEQAEKALHQSVNLTTQLLTFSKGGKPVKKRISLEPVIQNAAKFALSGSRSVCTILVDYGLWQAEADEGQISQVIQNIVLNADQAMPEGGQVEITAKNVHASDKTLSQSLQKGNYVVILIKDSGIGISDQYFGKIFDPYFTTKEKGSGLGLATSYSIIKNHNGMIEVSSTKDKGSTFSIYIPALAEQKEDPVMPATAATAMRTGRVLLMDDEQVVREVAGELIKALGHEVEFAAHGDEAVDKFKTAQQGGKPFDLVILDLTIRGGMGGVETVRQLLKIDPQVKAIVSSGYSDDAATANYEKQGFRTFLKKPYDLEALREVLNKLITR